MLNGVSLEIEPGGYTLIVGPTGSGKSTLALALIGALGAALHATVSGRVEVHGTDIAAADEGERSRLVAAVWQRPDVQLFRGALLDEVRAGLDHRLVPAAEGDARARSTLRLVGLDHLPEHRDPATLSGGEQQRLALAAALAQDAPVLVLDEATSALDGPAVRRFAAAIDRARAERELTVVAVDHRPDAHLGRADRLLVLENGRIVMDGRPEEIYRDRGAEVARLGLRLPVSAARRTDADRVGGGDAIGAAPSAVSGLAAGRPAAAESALRIDGVSVVVGRTRILTGVEADLASGSVLLVTGDNGAGKSTLLRVLAAELRPSGGRVRPSARARVRAGIGAAPQRAADLLLTGRVRDEVCSVLASGRRGDDEATRARAERLLGEAGLAELSDVHPLRLSGGQRQRLAVALAVATVAPGEPALVLLDEPTSAQDLAGAARVIELISAWRDERVTIIATHEPEAFSAIATHRLHLRAGGSAGVEG